MTDHIHILEIIDSRGNPTLKASYTKTAPHITAHVPSGASTGAHEAVELRDNDELWNGKGVSHAAGNARALAQQLEWEPANVMQADKKLLQVDGTPDKSRMGANALLALSLLQARVQAHQQKIPLHQLVANLAHTKPALPLPFSNVINGGDHAGNALAFQEFMIVPVTASTFYEATRIVCEVTHALKKIIAEKYGAAQTSVGDEGGFAPDISSPQEACELLLAASKLAGHEVAIALDAAASEFLEGDVYVLSDEMRLSSAQLAQVYVSLAEQYPIVSIEDPFAEDDFASFAALRKLLEDKGLTCQVVGDDLTVTNPERIHRAINAKSANSLLLKVNQIGTVTESIHAAQLAFDNDWTVMVSHRSGETEDAFIADLATGLGCGQIKLGAPVRGERTAKYNQLLWLEDQFRLPLRNDFHK